MDELFSDTIVSDGLSEDHAQLVVVCDGRKHPACLTMPAWVCRAPEDSDTDKLCICMQDYDAAGKVQIAFLKTKTGPQQNHLLPR